ncbi:MAG: nicotinate-nucleotide adenylyltransferase [Ruminococcus sp.]|nr:nicotinate-nucleotide adenylyltransferase [Ruminococcus sp.]
MSGAIGLFGGTFDPVHLGHRHILEAAISSVGLDKVYVMPAKIPPHKAASGLTTENDRFEMCCLAFEDIPKVEVSDHELRQEGKSYSYYTVKYLKELFPDSTLYFIMGSDQLLSFNEWYRYEDIISMANIIAISREDDLDGARLAELSASLTSEEDKITVLNVKPFPVSSTLIRDMIKNGLDCSCYLDKKVLDYIKSNELYSGKKKFQDYKNFIKSHLSKKRAQHSFNVAEAAVKLARQYGADEDKAYLAGLLHDVCKELPPAEQLEYVNRSDLDVSEVEKGTVALYHAIAGSVFVKEHFGIQNEEIIRAIRYHTVACGNMDKLSQIIYLADLISEDRDYKDVKKMRKYAEQGLEKAMLEALKFSIADSVGKENTIPLCTLESYNYFVRSKKS